MTLTSQKMDRNILYSKKKKERKKEKTNEKKKDGKCLISFSKYILSDLTV